MAGTIRADIIQSELGTPTVFRNGSGTEIGRLARSMLNYKGNSPYAVNASFNVSSVTAASGGDYTVNFSTAFSDGFYTASSCVNYNTSFTRGGNYAMIAWDLSSGSAPTASAFRFATALGAASGANGGLIDCPVQHWTFTR